MDSCKIVEDLLPLYVDDLLQDETKQWLEEHLITCSSCQSVLKQIKEPILIDLPNPNEHAAKTMKKAQNKIKMYEFILISLAFLLAMRTTVVPELTFNGLWTYALLGALLYTFYRAWLPSILLSFVPSLLYYLQEDYGDVTWLVKIMSAASMGGIYTGIALIGTLIAYSWIKAFEKERKR